MLNNQTDNINIYNLINKLSITKLSLYLTFIIINSILLAKYQLDSSCNYPINYFVLVHLILYCFLTIEHIYIKLLDMEINNKFKIIKYIYILSLYLFGNICLFFNNCNELNSTIYKYILILITIYNLIVFYLIIYICCCYCILYVSQTKDNSNISNKIKKLYTYKYIPNKNKINCSICLDDYNEGDIIKLLNCSHEFHSKCLDEWLNINLSCPICRQNPL